MRFDAATQLAFASCGDGTVTIAHEDAPDKLTVVQTLKTARGARTMRSTLARTAFISAQRNTRVRLRRASVGPRWSLAVLRF